MTEPAPRPGLPYGERRLSAAGPSGDSANICGAPARRVCITVLSDWSWVVIRIVVAGGAGGDPRCRLHGFRNNEARLQVHALANELASFLRTLAMPDGVGYWSLTTLRERRIEIGAKVGHCGRYFTFQMAEVAIPRPLFVEISRRIGIRFGFDRHIRYATSDHMRSSGALGFVERPLTTSPPASRTPTRSDAP